MAVLDSAAPTHSITCWFDAGVNNMSGGKLLLRALVALLPMLLPSTLSTSARLASRQMMRLNQPAPLGGIAVIHPKNLLTEEAAAAAAAAGMVVVVLLLLPPCGITPRHSCRTRATMMEHFWNALTCSWMLVCRVGDYACAHGKRCVVNLS